MQEPFLNTAAGLRSRPCAHMFWEVRSRAPRPDVFTAGACGALRRGGPSQGIVKVATAQISWKNSSRSRVPELGGEGAPRREVCRYLGRVDALGPVHGGRAHPQGRLIAQFSVSVSARVACVAGRFGAQSCPVYSCSRYVAPVSPKCGDSQLAGSFGTVLPGICRDRVT